ncbi:MAG TPA: serine/threonine-protein kinase [Kofleriaceae bacterium]|jgi:serine/threonine protein kinase/tetratricopeptide (TPR) repeat protein|nr:serine/threonine-protein kinase [Kofleriaceae bacterium]
MESNQRDHAAAGAPEPEPATATAADAPVSGSAPGSVPGSVPGSAAEPAPADPQRTEQLAAIPFPEGGIASGLRKAQVRAALFRKVEPLKIGRFVLLEPLGSGAMGEIYSAYDDQLDRKVALKLVRSGSGLHTKADDRLLREAQTLAQVSHPNVVHIYEAGAYNGRLFIAMELIRGKTLSRWLTDAAQLPRAVRQREILRQFIAAGRGLEAAHAAGVAHRDFKPDNVLVGDDGRVRVVDFGLARALGGEPDPEPADTKPSSDAKPSPDATSAADARPSPDGGVAPTDRDPAELPRDRPAPASLAPSPLALVTGGITIDHAPAPAPAARRATGGDPSASAPRLKAALRLTETGTVMGTPSYMAPEQMNGAIADLRSDQFSFCVALYHALYETFPFSGKSLPELKDAMASGAIAAVPGAAVPAFVRKALLRGLAVDPAQRFPHMADLLAMLEPGTHRMRGWIAAGACLVAIAVPATALTVRARTSDPCAAAGAAIDAPWSVLRQTALHAAFRASELPFAEPTWRGVQTRLDDYATRWRGEATAACRATQIAHTQSADQLDKRMLCLDRGRRGLAALVGELATATPDAVTHAIEATETLPELDACSRPEDLVFGVAPPPLAIAPQVAALRDQLARASALERLGRADDALAIARPTIAAAERLGYPAVHAEALNQTARALMVRGTPDARVEAEPLYFAALDLAEAARHDELAAEIWDRLVTVAVRMDSGAVQARAWWRRSAAAVHRLGDGAYELAKLDHMLGEIDYRDGKYAAAADDERRAIATIARAPGHPTELSRYDDGLAKALEQLDGLDEALQLHERALAIATAAFGDGHPNVRKLEINYGSALEQRGQRARARGMLEAALATIPARDRDVHPDAGRILGLLSDVDYAEGKLDAADDHGRASLAVFSRGRPPNATLIAAADISLGNVEFQRRHFDQALELYGDALALRRRSLAPDHYQIGVTEGNIAETLVDLERCADALPHVIEAERIFDHGSGHDRVTRAWIFTVHGEALVGQHQHAAAVPILERVLALGDAASPTYRALAAVALARALHGLGTDPVRVRSLAEQALSTLTAGGPIDAHRRDAVAHFLAQLPPR